MTKIKNGTMFENYLHPMAQYQQKTNDPMNEKFNNSQDSSVPPPVYGQKGTNQYTFYSNDQSSSQRETTRRSNITVGAIMAVETVRLLLYSR